MPVPPRVKANFWAFGRRMKEKNLQKTIDLE
jgi:hypothetical protein